MQSYYTKSCPGRLKLAVFKACSRWCCTWLLYFERSFWHLSMNTRQYNPNFNSFKWYCWIYTSLPQASQHLYWITLLLRWSQWNCKGLLTRRDCMAEKAVCVTLVIGRSLNCTSACGLFLLLMLSSLPFYYTQIGRYLIRRWRSYSTFLYSDDECVSLSMLSVISEARHIKCALFYIYSLVRSSWRVGCFLRRLTASLSELPTLAATSLKGKTFIYLF